MEFHIIEGVVLAKGKGLYELDGVRVQVDSELIVEQVPSTVNLVKKESRTLYDNGTEQITISELYAKLDALDARDEDGTWYTVEDRRKYEALQRSYTGKTEYFETITQVKFSVLHYGPSPDPLIKSLRMCGELKPLYRYTTNWDSIWRRLMVKYNYTEGTGKGRYVAFPIHSKDTGQYIKINDTFTRLHRPMKLIVAGTLDECVTALNDDVAFIEQMFTISEDSLTGGNLDPLKIVGLLQGLYDNVQKLSVNKSSRDDRSAMLSRLRESIAAITRSDEYKR